MLSFSVIICYSEAEVGLYSLKRKMVIAAFKLNKNNLLRPSSRFREKKRRFVSRKPSCLEKANVLYLLYICMRSQARANYANIQACAVGMRNEILRNKLHIIGEKLRLQSWVFDLFIVSRHLAQKVAMAIL